MLIQKLIINIFIVASCWFFYVNTEFNNKHIIVASCWFFYVETEVNNKHLIVAFGGFFYVDTEVNIKHLNVASCWFLSLYTFLTVYGHRNLQSRNKL